MKKLFTFLFAVMFAFTAFASESVAFTAEDYNGTGTVSSGSQVTLVKDPVTFSCNKAYGDEYSLRCYKNGVITVEVANGVLDSVIIEYGEYTKTTDLIPTVESDSKWTYDCTAQARIATATVYYTLNEDPGVTTDLPANNVSFSQDAYNIQGMKVSENYHGIVIQNGKKYLK